MSKPKTITDCKNIEEIRKYFPEAIKQVDEFTRTGPDLLTGDRADDILAKIDLDKLSEE